MGLTDVDVDAWLNYQRETGWTYPSGRPITAQNFHRSLRMWRVIKERIAERNAAKRERELQRRLNRQNWWIAARDAADEKRRAEAKKARQNIAATEEGWQLCREECAHCSGIGCARGIKIPPAHQSWPKPPRECPCFKGKEA